MALDMDTTVGNLTQGDCGKIIRLSNGEETHDDVLLIVRHRKGFTHIETEQHWEGEWPAVTPCTILTRKEGRK